jgi:hypothetical protein
VSTRPHVPATRNGTTDGLAGHVAAVEAARAKLGRDLDQLDAEVRAQVSSTMERTTWQIVGTGAAILTGILVRKLLMALWTRLAKHEPPTNPGAPDTSWSEGLAWAVASGAAVGVGRLVATRGATLGWQRVTGALPPGVADAGR